MNFLSDNVAILTLLGLIAVVLILLGVVVWAALRGANEAKKPQSSQVARLSVDSLKKSFRQAVELIETNVVSRAERYNIPWVLVIHEKGGTESLPLVQSGLQSALSADATMKAAAHGMSWNFFDKGIAIQLQADSLGSPESDHSDNPTWNEFLGLCLAYRPDRPFDSVVLSVSAQLLLRDDPQALLETVATAKSIHRRLWLAQNRFALRFPIYLVVSDCDEVPGFAQFASGLPDALRSSILGWSTPYELSAPYQSSWVDEAMNAVVSSLSDATAEMSALELPHEDSASYFLLPNAVERLRGGLKLFADELMRPSAYHEPFMLRGFYLTGDCSDSVVLRAQSSAMQATGPGLATDMAVLNETQPLSTEGQDWGVRPAFLKDIFESKVFAETGLVRPSSTQRMQRPLINRTARWLGVGVVGFWSIGLAFSSLRLDSQVSGMVAAISRMQTSGAQGGPQTSGAYVGQQRDVENLSLLAKIESVQLASFFMPGSLSYFDPIQVKLQARIEHIFVETALKPVQLGLDTRLSELTGVATDPSTGFLIHNAPCTLPVGWAEHVANKTSSGISVEELAEFSATLQFMTQVEALDRALQAKARLSDVNQRPAGADATLIMKTLLGFEVLGNEDRLAELFKKYAGKIATVTLAPMQAAASCALDLALNEIRKKLFLENQLMQIENAIAERLNPLLDGSYAEMEPPESIQALKSLLEDLQLQEGLSTPGKGVWMQESTIQLGKAYDDLMQRAQASALIGPDQVAKMNAQGQEQFALFAAAWAQALESSSTGLGNGLVWSEKDNKWAFSAERAALRSSLADLLRQSYFRVSGLETLPAAVGLQTFINWDDLKLDKVLQMADRRKNFRSDLLPKFPVSVMSEVDSVVSRAITANMAHLLAQAMLPMPWINTSVMGGDAQRIRLTQIQMALLEMGNIAAANNLQALISSDALARLKDLDDVLVSSEVYQVRDSEFQGWRGEKNPMLQAFAVADPLALASYAADQQSLLDGLSKEAEKLLTQISAGQSSSLLVKRWQAIVKDLMRYRNKSPSSNLLALEQFVQTGALDLELKNCTDKVIVKPIARYDGDVFLERLQQIQSGLQRRCSELRVNEQQAAWNKFALAFNRDLAGYAPFASSAVTTPMRTAADVSAIAKVLELFDRVVQVWPEQSLNTKPAYSVAVQRSVEQMGQVQAFMAPLFDNDDNATPGYDVSIEFRSNQANEVDGNKIIEWRLAIGAQVLRQRDPARPLRWESGKDIELSMRIAKDIPVQVLPDELQPWMQVDDKVVSYRFSDPWALMSFVTKHREPKSSAQKDNRSQLLRFEFPLLTNGVNPKQMPVESRAKVFVKLGISPVGKRSLLAWPAVFPSKIPDWTAP